MFDWRESQTFRKYSKAIDKTCKKMISVLHETKTNNLSLLAKKASMSPALVHYYYDKLTSRNILKLKVKVNVRSIGLQPIEVILKNRDEKSYVNIESKLRSIEYWKNIGKYYVQMETYWYVYYNIPKEAMNNFNRFIRSLEKNDVEIVYINYNPIEINTKPNIDWFNEEERLWDFQWDKWIDEILLEEEMEIPTTKVEEYIVLDKPDVFILKKLEEDAETSFKEIANEMGVTPPTIRYHYYKHLIKYGVIEGYEAELALYPDEISLRILNLIQFSSRKHMSIFLTSLEGKPFSNKATINLENNTAIIYSYVPFDQITDFNKTLIKMKKLGIIKDCIFGLTDRKSIEEKPLPMNLYEKGKWMTNFNF
ncbi:MAG: Lrp/AsnC family transcriptional regulator [Candidatus Methanomethylicia archaeon]|nr:Lrp/AsnC family transcriptional regulator [Candidatus Methanomethylicia archaeon]MCX8169019.1 Lrp/AsnC family transcriptional regulator [Candidatus Methanomethylicia archaeon]MDW7988751.1 Lrp/AsnC family transcriptional regulator [Nitrososphaerota archaeon]